MANDLQALVDKARTMSMTAAQREEQRRNFAYGNSKIENDHISRASIDKAAERIKADNPHGTKDKA